MSTTTISLARLIELDVPRAWHESVAVALEAGEAMRLAGRPADASACVINGKGELRVEGHGRTSDIETAVVTLLASMLEGQSAPPELKALATASGPPRKEGVDGLLEALAYFERPNRKAAIAALASRALATEAQAQADTELARLRSTPSTTPNRSESPHAARRGVPVGLTTILLLLVAAGVAAAFWYLNRPPMPSADVPVTADGAAATEPTERPSTPRSLVNAASEALASAADAGLRAIGLAPSEPAPAAPTSSPAAAASAPRRAPRAAAESPAAAAAVPAPAISTPATAASPSAVLPIAVAEPDESEMPPEPPPGPFTEADTDVEPPVLVYPQLPSDSQPAPPASAPHFELLVNERGEVDQVRLRATDVQFQDRMMVSAAKAWRFRPATKDGKPVRYRVRVPIPR